MSVLTIESIVHNGEIRLPKDIHLPDRTKVYVLVPDVQIELTARLSSPRLVHPEQAKDFQMEVTIDPESHAGV